MAHPGGDKDVERRLAMRIKDRISADSTDSIALPPTYETPSWKFWKRRVRRWDLGSVSSIYNSTDGWHSEIYVTITAIGEYVASVTVSDVHQAGFAEDDLVDATIARLTQGQG